MVNVQEDIKRLLQNTVRKAHFSKLTSSGSIENKKKLSSFMGHLLQVRLLSKLVSAHVLSNNVPRRLPRQRTLS